MAKSKVIGIDNWTTTINEISIDSEKMASAAVYQGAGVITDGLRAAIQKLSARSGGYGRYWIGVTDEERQGLLDGLGITQHKKNDGIVSTKIGFDGYNAYKTKKYPQGHPNSMVARTLETGTSWLHKTPFIAPTVRRLKESAVAAMQAELDKNIRNKEK